MKYLIVILSLLLGNMCLSQTFINRAGPANTVIDARLGASQNFYLPRLADTTLSGGKDSIGNLIYDRLRGKIAIRDTVLTGGHKFTFLFKTEDTLTTLATRYDLTQLSGDNISNASLTANGSYSQNWSENPLVFDSIASLFMFRMGGVGNTGTRRKEFIINWGGSAFGDQFDAFNMLTTIRKGDNTADSLTLGMKSNGVGVLSVGTYNVSTPANNTFISYSATAGLINIQARDSIWIKGATPAATADSILAVVYRSPTASRIVKIPLSAAVSATLQQVTDNGNKTTDTIIAGGLRTSTILGDTLDQDDYEIDVFPDIQGYTGNSGTQVAPMDSMFNWVVRNTNTENIKALIQVGDLTNVQANLTEMDRADAEFDKLDAINMTYLPVIGNHDYNSPIGSRNATGYNSYFGPSRYTGKPFYGGCMDGSNENFFIQFEAGGHKYAAIGIEFLPRDTALNWAQKIIDSLYDREIIIVTHAYIGQSGERARDTTTYSTCAGYGFAECNNGEQMWQKLIKKNKRIFLVLSGHFIRGFGITPPVVKRLNDAGTGGNVVYQIVCNYQQDTLSGNGYFMRMKFKPRQNKISVSFYSPYLGYYDARFPSYDLSYPGISIDGAVGISDAGGGLNVGGEARFDSSVKITGIPLNYIVKNDNDGNITRSQIKDDGTNVTINGSVNIPVIASGATPPTTIGTTKIVISDANGTLSTKDIADGVGNYYIKNQTASAQSAGFYINTPSVISESGTYRSTTDGGTASTLTITEPNGSFGSGVFLQQAGSVAPRLSFYHTTNSDINVQTPTATGDVIGVLKWIGNRKSDSALSVLMDISSFARVGGTHTGGEFIFRTRDTTTGTLTDRMHLTSTGDLRIGGTATTAYRFHIQSGDAYIAGNTYTIGKHGIGTTTPTARLHLPAGTATASTAPLKFTTGINLSTPEDGAVEYDGTHYYGTIGSTRYQLDQQSGNMSIGGAVAGGTDGSVLFRDGGNLAEDNANLFWDNTNNRLGIGTSSPSEKLHAVGTSLIEGVLRVKGATDKNLEFYSYAGDVYMFSINDARNSSPTNTMFNAGTNFIFQDYTTGSLVERARFSGNNFLVGSSTDNTVGRFQLTGKITVSEHDIGSNSDSAIVWNRTNNAYEYAKINIGNINTDSIAGTATNDNAVAGNIGEYVESVIASGSAVSLTTTTTANVTSISLTSGDWDVTGVVDYAMTAATATNFNHGISSTSATLGAQDTYVQKPLAFAGSGATLGDNTPVTRLSLSGTTTVYLVAQATFSGGSIGAYGTIRARRVR